MRQSRKTRAQRPATKYQTYYFSITDWEPSYSFSLSTTEWREGPYWEHSELRITAECLSPRKVKGRVCKCILLGDRRDTRYLEEPPQSDWKPLCVGTLTIRGEQTDYLGSIPQDALWGLMSALGSGAIRVLDLHGEVLHRGKASIGSIAFSREIDPDEIE